MTFQGALLALFWGSVFIILYCYVGFPLLLLVRRVLFPSPKTNSQPNYYPKASVIIAVHNEAHAITKKIETVLTSNYPREQLEIIVASDGSTDGTNELVTRLNAPTVKLLTLPRMGKNAVINEAVQVATGEILIFTDADSFLLPNSLKHLVAPFGDAGIGGVAGDFQHFNQQTMHHGELAYWNYDRILKHLETVNGSVSGAAGSLYAIRRSLFKPVPSSVTDDFYLAMQVVSSHQRLVFESLAVAYGEPAPSARAEFNRKVRIITRGLHGVWLMRHLLNPFSYGFFAIQLFTHKLLRRLMAIPLILLAITAPLLWPAGWLYQAATVLQFGFHTIALLGFVLQNTTLGQTKLFGMPYHFDLIYFATLIALFNNFRGKQYATWKPARLSDPT